MFKFFNYKFMLILMSTVVSCSILYANNNKNVTPTSKDIPSILNLANKEKLEILLKQIHNQADNFLAYNPFLTPNPMSNKYRIDRNNKWFSMENTVGKYIREKGKNDEVLTTTLNTLKDLSKNIIFTTERIINTIFVKEEILSGSENDRQEGLRLYKNIQQKAQSLAKNIKSKKFTGDRKDAQDALVGFAEAIATAAGYTITNFLTTVEQRKKSVANHIYIIQKANQAFRRLFMSGKPSLEDVKNLNTIFILVKNYYQQNASNDKNLKDNLSKLEDLSNKLVSPSAKDYKSIQAQAKAIENNLQNTSYFLTARKNTRDLLKTLAIIIGDTAGGAQH